MGGWVPTSDPVFISGSDALDNYMPCDAAYYGKPYAFLVQYGYRGIISQQRSLPAWVPRRQCTISVHAVCVRAATSEPGQKQHGVLWRPIPHPPIHATRPGRWSSRTQSLEPCSECTTAVAPTTAAPIRTRENTRCSSRTGGGGAKLVFLERGPDSCDPYCITLGSTTTSERGWRTLTNVQLYERVRE